MRATVRGDSLCRRPTTSRYCQPAVRSVGRACGHTGCGWTRHYSERCCKRARLQDRRTGKGVKARPTRPRAPCGTRRRAGRRAAMTSMGFIGFSRRRLETAASRDDGGIRVEAHASPTSRIDATRRTICDRFQSRIASTSSCWRTRLRTRVARAAPPRRARAESET